MNPLGIYIHTPFCASKCAYCDFYSFPASPEIFRQYQAKLLSDIEAFGKALRRPCDTLYFGGGTPSLPGGDYIASVTTAVERQFGFCNPEITLEANPQSALSDTLCAAARAGVNRISFGVQSGEEAELKALGRRHTAEDAKLAVADAKAAGIFNISLDLMLGIPLQTMDSLRRSIDFLCGLEPSHISAYMLKIENGTPFGKTPPQGLPDEDLTVEMYLFAVEQLRHRGYMQYEISNFALDGKASRHNMKYWTGADYLGIGPAAHSMIGGRRFYFPRDFDGYMHGARPLDEGRGNDSEEYFMLRLRLSSGLNFADYRRRFGRPLSEHQMEQLRSFDDLGFGTLTESRFSLTPKGFLIANYIISELI